MHCIFLYLYASRSYGQRYCQSLIKDPTYLLTYLLDLSCEPVTKQESHAVAG